MNNMVNNNNVIYLKICLTCQDIYNKLIVIKIENSIKIREYIIKFLNNEKEFMIFISYKIESFNNTLPNYIFSMKNSLSDLWILDNNNNIDILSKKNRYLIFEFNKFILNLYDYTFEINKNIKKFIKVDLENVADLIYLDNQVFILYSYEVY